MDATCHGYYIQLFEGFFPKQLLQTVIDIVNEKMDGDKEVVYGEFIWWIGIWVLMSTVDGADQHSFWSTKNVNAPVWSTGKVFVLDSGFLIQFPPEMDEN